MRLLTRLLAIIGLPVFLFVVGCAASDEFTATPNGTCTVEADCADGEICLAFMCLPSGPDAPDLVSIELAPPDGSGYARTQLLDVPIAGLADGPLVLPVPTEYEAQITDADSAPISAFLSIFGTPRIAGREIDVNATVAAGNATPTVFRLLEGSYVVRIRPNVSDVPGMEITGFTVRPQPEPTVKQFALPPEFRRLYGEVTSSLSTAEKLEGVTVVAYGEKSGLASTVSVSDEYGRYELLLPATSDTTFRLVASPPAAAHPAWGFEQIVGGIDADAGRQRAIRLEPTTDDLRGTARIQVLGTTSDGRLGAPVADAFVTLTATVTGVVEPPVFAITGRTDADGVLVPNLDGDATTQVPLLRAKYVVKVVPPINTPYKAHREVLDLTAARPGFVLDQQVTLTERPLVTGVVRSAQDRPVAGALVDLLPLAPDNRIADAVTDADGTFSVTLDPGPYLVVARPLSLTDLGEAVPVTAARVEVTEVARQYLPDLRAAHGEPVRLQVAGEADGAPVEGTRAELFVRIEGEVVSLGRADTEADGTFTAVVPVSSESAR